MTLKSIFKKKKKKEMKKNQIKVYSVQSYVIWLVIWEH